MQGITTKVWVSEDGELLREENTLGFVSVKEDIYQAMKAPVAVRHIDLANRVSIPVQYVIQNPIYFIAFILGFCKMSLN